MTTSVLSVPKVASAFASLKHLLHWLFMGDCLTCGPTIPTVDVTYLSSRYVGEVRIHRVRVVEKCRKCKKVLSDETGELADLNTIRSWQMATMYLY